MQEIGDMQNPKISRERVRQILKRSGINAEEGGSHLRAFLRFCAKKPKTKEKYLPYFNCLKSVALELNGGEGLRKARTPALAYVNQKKSAGYRKIKWELTFPEWMEIWKQSGHFDERGQGTGKYCMARICDRGSYSLGNVEIITHNQNSIDARAMDKIRAKEKAIASKHNLC